MKKKRGKVRKQERNEIDKQRMQNPAAEGEGKINYKDQDSFKEGNSGVTK